MNNKIIAQNILLNKDVSLAKIKASLGNKFQIVIRKSFPLFIEKTGFNLENKEDYRIKKLQDTSGKDPDKNNSIEFLTNISNVLSQHVEVFYALEMGLNICRDIYDQKVSLYSLAWYLQKLALSDNLINDQEQFEAHLQQFWPDQNKWNYEKRHAGSNFLGSPEFFTLAEIIHKYGQEISGWNELSVARQISKQATLAKNQNNVQGFVKYLKRIAIDINKAQQNEELDTFKEFALELFEILSTKIKEQQGDYYIAQAINKKLPARHFVLLLNYNQSIYQLSFFIEPEPGLGFESKLSKIMHIKIFANIKKNGKILFRRQKYLTKACAEYNVVCQSLNNENDLAEVLPAFTNELNEFFYRLIDWITIL